MAMFFIFGFPTFDKIEKLLGHLENVHRVFSKSNFLHFQLKFPLKTVLFILPIVAGATRTSRAGSQCHVHVVKITLYHRPQTLCELINSIC